MGLKLAAIASSALALAAATPADYVASRQQADGGFAEPGARSDSALTAWAVLGLKAAGRRNGTVVYLRDAPVADTTDLALRVMALRAVGESPEPSSPGFGGSGGATAGSARSSTRRSGACSPSREGRSEPSATCSDASGHPAAGRGPRTARRTPTTRRPSGAPLERRPWPADPARALLHPQPHRPNGGVRLVAGRAGRPVDGVGRPGLPRRRRQASRRCLPLPRRSGGRTAATATAALRRHAGDRDRARSSRRSAGSRFHCADPVRLRPPQASSATRSSTSVLVEPAPAEPPVGLALRGHDGRAHRRDGQVLEPAARGSRT